MGTNEAIIKAIELTDKMLNQDGLDCNIASVLLGQRLALIEKLIK